MYNKIILIGNIGQDAEVRTLPSGKKVMNFSLATSRRVKNGEGYAYEPVWHNITVFNQNIIEYKAIEIKKGCQVFLEGELVYEEYLDKDSNKKQITKIQVNIGHELKVLKKQENKEQLTQQNAIVDDDMPF